MNHKLCSKGNIHRSWRGIKRGAVLSVLTVASVFVSASVLGNDIPAQPTVLTDQEQALVDWVDDRATLLLDELKLHVNQNTGTQNISGLNSYRSLLQQELDKLGFETATHSSESIPILNCEGGQFDIADHLTATMRGPSSNRLFLNGHMDTVFGVDDEFQTLLIEDDGTLKGPGVADMKGGIVIMLNALRALEAHGLLKQAHMTVLLNSDEEIGSLGSRPLIETIAREHDLGLVFEGSYQNLVTRARKGLGQARIKVTGRESHAGAAHEEGVSASLELALKIIAIEGLTDYSRQTTVNVGVMAGGEKRNTIPGCAEAYIDMRFPDQESGQELKQAVLVEAGKKYVENNRHPGLPTTEVWATLHRPVKAPHPVVDDLIRQAMGLSEVIGEPIVGSRLSGGGTDGSIAQGVGLPTMDSLGMDGSGAHSSREQSSVKTLVARTKLAAVLLARLIQKNKE
ncbi:MAG: M20/M25/M40 family metallo-hydrolase [Pseudomonadota bacterium]